MPHICLHRRKQL